MRLRYEKVTSEDNRIKDLAAAVKENKAAIDRAHRLIDKRTLRLESVCPEAVIPRPHPKRDRRFSPPSPGARASSIEPGRNCSA